MVTESSKKILVLSNTFAGTQLACDYLRNGGFQVLVPPQLSPADKNNWVMDILANASAVIVGHDRIDRKVIENAPLLKVIAKQGVGLDNIDTQTAKERGIKIVTAVGGNSDSVADHTILLILAVSRQLLQAADMVRNGGWDRIIGHEIWNKNLGIIGFGEIGQKVASRAKGFSMAISYYDIVDHKEAEQILGAVRMELPGLMKWADYVSIHVPLDQRTLKLVDSQMISLMKPTAYLINTSRGGVVDETALLEALQNKKVSGAGLDVFEQEPLLNLALCNLPNVVATPHMAAYTFEAIERVSLQVAHSVLENLTAP